MVIIIVVLLVLGAGIGLLLWRRSTSSRSKDKSVAASSVLDFFVRGNQLGFSITELRALRGLAREFKLRDPNNMLLSQSHLDRSLRQILREGVKVGILTQETTIKLLSKVFEYRMTLEKKRPRYRKGLESTRLIEAGQVLKMLATGVGVFQVRVIENFRSYIAVEKPSGKGAPATHHWKDQRLDIYFWRKGDALYYFETFVVNDPDKAALQPVLQLSHSEKLVRTQKRNAIRVKVMKMGSLTPLASRDEADEVWKPSAGYQCKVTDISETGAAILVRGKVQAGKMVKLQVELGGLPVIMCGEIKGSTLNAAYNVSLLHIEAMPPLSSSMAIRVQAFVLGLVTDEAPVEVAAVGGGLGENQDGGEEAAARENLDSLPQGPEATSHEPASPEEESPGSSSPSRKSENLFE
jgi:hypothetical protein